MTSATSLNQHDDNEVKGIFPKGETFYLARDIHKDKRVYPINTNCIVVSHNKDQNTVDVTALGQQITVAESDLVSEPDNPLLPFASLGSRPSEVAGSVSSKKDANQPKKSDKHKKKQKKDPKKSKPKPPSSWSCCFSKSTIDSDSDNERHRKTDAETESTAPSSRSSTCHVKGPPSPGNIASPPRPEFTKPDSMSGSMKEKKDASPLKVSFSGDTLSKLDSTIGKGKEGNVSTNSIPIKAITSSSSSGRPTTGDTSNPELFDSKKVWEERGMNSTVELLAASAASDLNAMTSPPAPLNTPASPLPLAAPEFPAASSPKIAAPASTSSHSSTERTAPVNPNYKDKDTTKDEASSHPDEADSVAAPTSTALANTTGGLSATLGASEVSRTSSRGSSRSRRRRDRSDSTKKDKRERRSSSRRSRSDRSEKERRRRRPPELAKVPENNFSRSVDGSRSPLVSPPQSTFCVPPAAIPIDSTKLSSSHQPTAATSAATGITSMTSMTSSLEIIPMNTATTSSSSTDTTNPGIAFKSMTSSASEKDTEVTVDNLFGKSGQKSAQSTSRAPYHKYKDPSPSPAKDESYGSTPVIKSPKSIGSTISTPVEAVQATTPVHVDVGTQPTPLSEMLNSPQFASPSAAGPAGLVMTASITKLENEFIGIDVEQETFIIKSIAPDGAAARAGLDWRFIGMQLTHINGQEIRGIDDAAKLATSEVVTIICSVPQSGAKTEQYYKGWHDGFTQASCRPPSYSPVSPPRIWSPGYRKATTASYAAVNPIDEWKSTAKGVMGYTKVKWIRSPIRGDGDWIDSLRVPTRSSSRKRRTRNR